MKVIFLDIDGVLVTRQSEKAAGEKRRDYFRQYGEDIPAPDRYALQADKACVAALNEITDTTDACIVVSSQWRRGLMVAELRNILGAMGVTGKVRDKTRDGDTAERGIQIKAWLEGPGKARGVESYVVLDDFGVEGHEGRQVQTTWEHGLAAPGVRFFAMAALNVQMPHTPFLARVEAAAWAP